MPHPLAKSHSRDKQRSGNPFRLLVLDYIRYLCIAQPLPPEKSPDHPFSARSRFLVSRPPSRAPGRLTSHWGLGRSATSDAVAA